MKKFSFGIIALLLMGAGCPSLPWMSQTQTPPAHIPPSDAPTTPSIPKAPEGWQTYENVVHGFVFSYPGDVAWGVGGYNLSDTVASFDLGTQVSSTSAESVPTTELAIRTIPATDSRIRDCFFSESRWPDEANGIKTSHVTIGGRDVCLAVEQDAGAGNYYSSYAYGVKHDDEVIVLNFVVHSVNCLNYENPATQCVAFDEARDTKGFEEIVGTLGFTDDHKQASIDLSLFEQISKTDDTNVRQIGLTYAHLNAYENAAVQREFNRLVDEEVQKIVAQFKEDAGDVSAEDLGSAAGPWTLSLDTYQYAAPNNRVSVVFEWSEYTGGAHPNTFYQTMIFNLTTGKEEQLAEVFKEDVDYLQALSDYAIPELTRRNDIAEFTDAEWIASGAAPSSDNYASTYLSDAGVVVIFGPYQVAAYAAGPSEVVIPYSALQGKLVL